MYVVFHVRNVRFKRIYSISVSEVYYGITNGGPSLCCRTYYEEEDQEGEFFLIITVFPLNNQKMSGDLMLPAEAENFMSFTLCQVFLGNSLFLFYSLSCVTFTIIELIFVLTEREFLIITPL